MAREIIAYRILSGMGAYLYFAAVLFLFGFAAYEALSIWKDHETIKKVHEMEYNVYQIDAWIQPDGTWTYNDRFNICSVNINGEPTTRRILKALRKAGILHWSPIYTVDDSLAFDGIWTVQLKSNYMPILDLEIPA